MIDEMDEEANWLAYLRRVRKALGNDASPETIAKWLAEHPQGDMNSTGSATGRTPLQASRIRSICPVVWAMPSPHAADLR